MSSIRCWVGVAALLAVVIAGPAPALAQKKDPPAEALFKEGKAAMSSGDYERACAKFRASIDLEPAPGTLFNLAECEEKRGKIATAWTLFGQVLQALPPSDERRSTVRSRIDGLAPKVPRLTVRLAPAAPAGTTVTLGDSPLAAADLGVAKAVDPGKVVLNVTAEGRAPRAFDVELRESDHKEIVVEPGAPQTAAAGAPPSAAAASGAGAAGGPTSPDPAPATSSLRTVGWIVGGVGVASLGVGIVTGVLVLGKKSTVESNCPDQRCHTQADVDAADAGKTLSLVSTITVAVGIAGIGAGAVLVLTGGKRAQSSRTVVVPVAASDGGALVAAGRF